MNVSKGEPATLYYRGLATGLTDVKLQLWDPDHVQQVTDGVATELGSKLYYYKFTSTNTLGDWAGLFDSTSRPKGGPVGFRVEKKIVGGGGGYSDFECLWTEEFIKKLFKDIEEIKRIAKTPKVISKDMAPLMVRMDEYKAIMEGIIASNKLTSQRQTAKLDSLEDIIVESLDPETLEKIEKKLKDGIIR